MSKIVDETIVSRNFKGIRGLVIKSFLIDEYPKTCKECPFFYKIGYSMSDSDREGLEGRCELGFMNKFDTRDFNGDELFRLCKIKENPYIYLKEEQLNDPFRFGD